MSLLKFVLLIITHICVATTHTELPRKWLTDKRSTQSPLMDPCHKERSMKMICHCEYESETNAEKLVKSAECWILKSDLTEQDLLWRAFDRYTGITDIQFIVQSSGSLSFLPTPVFTKLINLSDVSISYSNIEQLKPFGFGNSSSLRTLRLNHNNISELGPFAFANHLNLERIDLEENDLKCLHRDSFKNLSRLEYLALNTNQLVEIPHGTFRELNNLVELQLQHNLISVIVPEIFAKLENLRVLKLSSNKIKHIGNGAFIELWSLQQLYLDNNLIESISERAFDGLNNLRRLNLQRNHLRVLEKTVFVSLPIISSLNLADNRLKTLQRSTLSDIENFSKVDSTLILNGNEFVCDCKLNWLMELRNRTKSITTKKSLDRLKCLLTSSNNIPEELLWNTIEHANVGGNADYVSDEIVVTEDSARIDGGASAVDLTEGSLVDLFLVDQLPCSSEVESDPTSLPMPRESTVFRDSGISRQTPLVTVIIFSALVTSTILT